MYTTLSCDQDRHCYLLYIKQSFCLVGGGAGGGWGLIDLSQLQDGGTTAVQGSERSMHALNAYYCLVTTVQMLYFD